jgi:hypothetical protein
MCNAASVLIGHYFLPLRCFLRTCNFAWSNTMAEQIPSRSEVYSQGHPSATDWALDDEDLVEREAPDQPPGRRSPLPFFCSMALLGVVLALVWRYAGAAQLADQLWSSFNSPQATATLAAQVPGSPPPPPTAELDALKAEIGRLTAANQQMTAEITALRDQQRELVRRAASQTSVTNLFSDPGLLRLHIVPRTATNGAVSRVPATPSPGRPAPKNGSAPLALGPPNDRP